MEKHEIARVRREVVRRTLTVVDKHFVTPRMLRVRFHAEELSTFDSPSADDHVKIFLSTIDGQSVRRDFTPRSWDREHGTLTLEFALHAHGPAAEWARAARNGDTLEIGGPKGSTIVPDDFDWYLLVGDACVLPSIARRLESLRADVPAFVVALVAGPAEEQNFTSAAAVTAVWLHESGNAAQDVDDTLRRISTLPLPAGDGYIWIAGETEMSRSVYRYVVDERGHPAEWVKASAYWTRGEVGE